MTDEDLESRLRGFTVVPPPPRLRGRVLAAPGRRTLRRDALIGWAVAAGVAAVAMLGAWASGETREDRFRAALADPASAERLAFALDVFGDDAEDQALFYALPPDVQEAAGSAGVVASLRREQEADAW
jgi:hypothetical protein